MKHLLLLAGLLFVHTETAGAHGADSQLRVVATIPDIADIVRTIGGEHVDVTSIAAGTMNIHAVPLKPSMLIAVNRADLFVQMGFALEHAYVPGMLAKARNPKIRAGQPGFVDCSQGWEPFDVPESLSRSGGTDLHPLGNPHFNLDPRGGAHIAAKVLEGLVRVDPGNEAEYRAAYDAFLGRIDTAAKRWKELGEAMRGKRVVTYHSELAYFLRYYGIELFGTLEPKPGVPPTPKNLGMLISRMTTENVRVVLTSPWSNNKSVRFVQDKANATIVEVPTMVGGVPGADSWIEMMDVLHESVARALADG